MRNLLLGSVALAMSISVAHAAPISFLFNLPTGDRGTTQTYTTGSPPLSVIASGFTGTHTTSANSTVHLWGKNDGPGEQGVGLTNDRTGDHEITVGSFIQLDVRGLIGHISSLSAQFGFNSTTGTEQYAVYGSNIAGALGTQLTSGADQNMHILPSFNTYSYYDFAPLSGNVLLSQISANTVSTVPEPASMALIGTGLIGLGYFRRRAGRG